MSVENLPSAEFPSAPQLVDLKTAARMAATGRDGGAPHISSLCRWITKGTRQRDGSRLRLRAVRTPGGWRTSREWLSEFYDALTCDRLGQRPSHEASPAAVATVAPKPSTVPRTAARRRADSARAGELLARMGY